ncbi:MAG: electron transport complex subunit RsxC, partial [Deltaproteobacteria bacterium]
MKSLLTFPKGGVHPPDKKEQTAGLAIEVMPVPDELEIILGQHIGAPCRLTVSKRDTVTEGTLIGEVRRGLGVPLHSPVAGKIKATGMSVHPIRVSSPSVTIAVDHEAPVPEYTRRDWSVLSADELLEKVHAAGIIGIGGAGFPTHVKLKSPPTTKI